MKKHLLGLTATIILVAGCGGQKGNEFLGKWQNIKNPKDNFELVRNGDNFLLKSSRRNFITGQVDTENVPATYKDGTLEMQGGMGTVALAIDRSNGHLVAGGMEYQHPK